MGSPDDPGVEDRAQGDDEDEQDDRHRSPSAAWNDIPPAPMPPIAPDGGPAIGGAFAPPPMPAPTPDNFICMRGPCRHFWELETHLESGNPAETWDAEHGLKTMKPCEACAGSGVMRGRPHRPYVGQSACGYKASQGRYVDQPCVLVEHHAGTHHYTDDPPPVQQIPCNVCDGSRVVPDPGGAPIRQPRKQSRVCLVHPGCETEFSDDLVYRCSRWDPVDPDDPEEKARARRRLDYLKDHPTHAKE